MHNSSDGYSSNSPCAFEAYASIVCPCSATSSPGDCSSSALPDQASTANPIEHLIESFAVFISYCHEANADLTDIKKQLKDSEAEGDVLRKQLSIAERCISNCIFEGKRVRRESLDSYQFIDPLPFDDER